MASNSYSNDGLSDRLEDINRQIEYRRSTNGTIFRINNLFYLLDCISFKKDKNTKHIHPQILDAYLNKILEKQRETTRENLGIGRIIRFNFKINYLLAVVIAHFLSKSIVVELDISSYFDDVESELILMNAIRTSSTIKHLIIESRCYGYNGPKNVCTQMDNVDNWAKVIYDNKNITWVNNEELRNKVIEMENAIEPAELSVFNTLNDACPICTGINDSEFDLSDFENRLLMDTDDSNEKLVDSDLPIISIMMFKVMLTSIPISLERTHRDFIYSDLNINKGFYSNIEL